MIRRFFSPPTFNEEDNFRAKFINGFAWIAVIALSAALVFGLIPGPQQHSITTIAILASLIAAMFLSLYLLRKGKLNASSLILITLGWLGLGLQAYVTSGAKDVIIIAFIAIALFASITLNWIAGLIIILLSVGAIWMLALLEINGIFHPVPQETFTFARDISFIFGAIAALNYFSTTSLKDAISRATRSEQSLLTTNKNLQELNQTLEERVGQRTAELDTVNRFNLTRARQFEAITKINHAVASILDLDTLLPRITQVISEQFNIYHTGIFLLDESREFAILRASNSEGGKRMLERGHKLETSRAGIVGFVAATGQPRIALDVGSDPIHFDNPDLPDTRSEAAMPLRIADRIIGVLDVQSIEANAFNGENLEVLLALADQVSVAINNTLTIQTANKALAEAQSILEKNIQDSWKVMRPKSMGVGFQLINSKVLPLEKRLEGEHIHEAIAKGSPILSAESNASSLAIPIRLRGQIIGVMDLRTRSQRKLTTDDAEIAQAVSERLSLAIETATLLQSTQHHADIERVTTNISTKISSSTHFETILQTAAQELSKALGGSDVIVQIEPGSMEMGMSS
jgi:GAF domain-containing protein